MRSFVNIASFAHAHEFAVLRLLLEKEELRFYFQNETTGSVVPFLGAITLKVHPDDVVKAKKIIQTMDDWTKLRKVP